MVNLGWWAEEVEPFRLPVWKKLVRAVRTLSFPGVVHPLSMIVVSGEVTRILTIARDYGDSECDVVL